jgi:cobyrinic acid a,c-diamide synthase
MKSRGFCISAVASNQGKTILTTALLWHFRDSVRPFKVGPDFIDPQFHKKVCGTPSINLDSFIMSPEQVDWLYHHYRRGVSIVEGVMGFYDGENKGCSAYGVSKLLNIPTIMVLDGGGSYITISAILKGLLTYREDNTIKAVVFNNLSSVMHFALIKKQIEHDHNDIVVLGWIKKNLPSLNDTHLGLDLDDLSKIRLISQEVLEHIDLKKLRKVHTLPVEKKSKVYYPFQRVKQLDKKLAIVHDSNFSFLYHDNLCFLKERYREVVIIDSTNNETIPKDCDRVYICGGYVETEESYKKIKDATHFKESLIAHSKTKPIYAECAGLLYLSNKVDDKEMSGIIDIEFTLGQRFNRLGYYYNRNNIKGHAFHYSKPTEKSLKKGFDILSKTLGEKGVVGSWSEKNSFGTYLHMMFRANPRYLEKSFIKNIYKG